MKDCAHHSCRKCPCAESAVVSRVESNSELAIVFGWPTQLEVKRDTWLTGKRGGAQELLARVLEASGADVDNIYYCSALNCQPNPTKKAMQKKGMVACRERLIQELRESGAKKVLCVGPEGYSALVGSPSVDAITKVRGRWKEAYGMHVMATLPPGFALNQVEYFRDIVFDVTKFLNTNGRESWPDIKIWIPETTAEAMEALDWLETNNWVSTDLETYGLSPVSNDVLAAGFGALEGKDATVLVLCEDFLGLKKIWRRLGRILNGDMEIVFHNAKFDLQFFKTQLEGRGLKYAPVNVHDTMMLHYALDERPMGKYKSHGLEHLAHTRYDAPNYGIGMGKWLEEFAGANKMDRRRMRLEMHQYLALDCYYTARLFPDLWNECIEEDESLLELYDDLLIPGTLALAQVEHHGLLVDRPMLEKSLAGLKKRANKTLARVQRSTGIPDFNPNSPKQVKELIYETLELEASVAMEALKHQAESGRRISSKGAKEGARSRGTYTDPKRLKESATAAPVLRMLARGYPEHDKLIEDICEYRNITKNAGAYISGWLTRLDEDGRLRTSINLHGTATGRLSSSSPNMQNVPPSSHTGIPIRSAIVAPPGYVIIGADYKQLEVRVAAILSKDPAMLELFKSGRDVHAEISRSIYNKPPEEISQYMRMLGKIVLFGLLYGRSPDSVATGPEQEDIVQRGGRRQTPDEVRLFFDNLLSDWAVYAEWRKNLSKNGYKEGQVKLPSGRIRRFDFIPRHDGGHVGRQSLNTPVQGTASDVTLDALIRLQARLPEGASVILTVHDALYVECREEDADEVEALMEDVMENSTFLGETEVPLKSDIKTGKRWDEEDDKLGSGVIVQAEES